MKLPVNTLDHFKVGNCTLVLYKWGKLSENSSPRDWENVEFFDKDGTKIWTVNGMEYCPYWDKDCDMFVSIGNIGNNWILNSYNGNSYLVDIKTGFVKFLIFHK